MRNFEAKRLAYPEEIYEAGYALGKRFKRRRARG